MLRLILYNQPEGSQLILGLEDLCGVESIGPVVTLTHKYSLLREGEYREAARILKPMQKAVVENLSKYSD